VFEKKHGFTLLELLVSLAVMGLMVAVVFGALRLGIRSWERGNQLAQAAQDHVFNWHLISRQLRSTYPFKGVGNKLYFQGEKDELAFISAYSLKMGDRKGLVRVIYRIEKDHRTGKTRFLVYEEPLLNKERLEEKVDKDDFLELLLSEKKISFSYEKQATTVETKSEEASWQEKWGSNDRGMPSKVKIVLESGGITKKKEEEDILLPIMVREDSKS